MTPTRLPIPLATRVMLLLSVAAWCLPIGLAWLMVRAIGVTVLLQAGGSAAVLLVAWYWLVVPCALWLAGRRV